MDKVTVIGDSDTVIGFMLAGVRDALVATPQTADDLVSQALSDPKVGILIITQEISKLLSPKTMKAAQTSSKPVVIEVPGKRDLSEPGQSINQMVKKAIGIDLK